MMWSIVTAPVNLPVTLDEAKKHLVVETSNVDDDDLINQYIRAATNWAERFTGRAFIEQTIDAFFDRWPTTEENWIEIPKPPLIELIGVFYTDGSEAEFTDYALDLSSEPARIYLPSSGSWPTTDIQPNAIRLRFRAGYLDEGSSPPEDSVPDIIKVAIMMYVAQMYRVREALVAGNSSVKPAWGAEEILREYSVIKSMA